MRCITAMGAVQMRNFAITLLVVAMLITCICFYLLAELAYLDGARLKLEREVMKLQQNKLHLPRRHLSYSDDLENVEFGDDDTVIIYNRVPKTGSTTLAGVMYELCAMNKFYVIHIGMLNRGKTIALSDQMRFLQNITSWEEKKPALYHGHVAFIDYSKFGVRKKPIYINIIRDPLDRLVSFYYFTRYGDDFRPTQERMRERRRETFDQCVERKGDDCDPFNLWLQVPYFCGHVAECWIPGSEWALNKAKQNVLRYYLIVGITEELEDFIFVLETTLPRFFKGALNRYRSAKSSRLRKTSYKQPLKPETEARIQESSVWQMENEFYQFVKSQFHYVKEQQIDVDRYGNYTVKKHKFQYEKIQPT